jgi:hypothetical protein
MKRYLFFVYEKYEPMGGWGDFVGSFDTINEILIYAKAKHEEQSYYTLRYKQNEFQIVDSTTSDSVLDGNVGDIIDGKVVDLLK